MHFGQHPILSFHLLGFQFEGQWQTSERKPSALFTCKAEYLFAFRAAQQTLWLRQTSWNFGRALITVSPLFEGRKFAIQVAEQTATTKMRKYISTRNHYLQHLGSTEQEYGQACLQSRQIRRLVSEIIPKKIVSAPPYRTQYLPLLPLTTNIACKGLSNRITTTH